MNPLAWLQGEDMDYGVILVIVMMILFGIAASFIEFPETRIISIIIATAPLWLPFLTFRVLYDQWNIYVGKKFILKNGRSTLRIHLPQEVLKSPEAMEYVLNQIWNKASQDNLWQTYIDGKRPLNYSLEIVSIGGDVRLYMNVPTKRVKDNTETMLYSQYPGVEVELEEIDYAAEIPLNSDKHDTFTAHMQKKGPSALPIKTYIDYGLDKLPKEEEKLDPMTPMLELLGRIKPHERVYVQILIKSHRDYNFKSGSLKARPEWTGEQKQAIEKIMQRDQGPSDFESQPRLTPGERDTIEAVERQMGKSAYETAIRWIYITEKGKFNGDIIGQIIRSFAQYDMNDRNGIGIRWRTDFNYNWFSDPWGTRVAALKRQEFKEYKLRDYFNKSQADNTKVFTTEELATMFHVPGSVAATPTLSRIGSTRSEAPSNLPTG